LWPRTRFSKTWYIVPEKAMRGMGAICLCSTMPKYEQYREAWKLLKAASGCEEAEEPVSDESDFSQKHGEMGHPQTPAGPAVARLQGAMNLFRNYLEKGGR